MMTTNSALELGRLLFIQEIGLSVLGKERLRVSFLYPPYPSGNKGSCCPKTGLHRSSFLALLTQWTAAREYL